ncbi:MAG: HAMP domain-containing histidine kinase, partial [Bacteroidaceae bacterium]|nr:HAMP domain-containing histidine kinase [Bacteroidaceae bacterium]
MKKITIWLVGLIMAVCCVALLFMQLSYIETMVKMRVEHFDEGVKRSLHAVAYNFEIDEMRAYLSGELRSDVEYARMLNEKLVNRQQGPKGKTSDFYTFFEFVVLDERPAGGRGASALLSNKREMSVQGAKSLTQDIIKMKYKHQRDVFDRVIYDIIMNAGGKPLQTRMNAEMLYKNLGNEFANCGIDLPFEFRVISNSGDTVFSSNGNFSDKSCRVYREALFANDVFNRISTLEVSFPTSYLNNFIYGAVKFMIPSLLFTLVMLITFVITLYMAIRHKKITQMKNDFINNMTHEFKTPISTISLAAQMLQDPSVNKSPEMFNRLSGVISSESKRLRFQVDKVLQMSMFDDKDTASLKMKELDANELVSNIVNTFTVKVEQNGGHIDYSLQATDPYIYVDEMHFTNVIFNLLDNAVKYKRYDVPISLEVHTWNAGRKF